MTPPFRRRSVLVTTAADGTATAYIPDAGGTAATLGDVDPLVPLNGEIRAIIYEKDDFANTVDFTITAEGSGLNVWTEANVSASKTIHPVVPASSQAGVALVFAAAGESVPAGPPVLANERLKIVIAQGGNATSGTFTVIVG